MIHVGDCLEVMQGLADNSIDSIVTDPPYGISFMAKRWDYDVPSVEVWRECMRVLKPGGHMLAFGGARTYHRLAIAIEDAGFEIRDQIQWLTGQGFPKSLNIGKATGSKEWDGWGTALKPANEPICLARKPLSEPTVAKNVLKWGTGGINVDGCRISATGERDDLFRSRIAGFNSSSPYYHNDKKYSIQSKPPSGRFPSNLILDEHAAAMLDEQSGFLHPAGNKTNKPANEYNCSSYHMSYDNRASRTYQSDKGGGASRFFYVAKASVSERNAGLEHRTPETVNDGRETPIDNPFQRGETKRLNTHPTVKPVALMAYLCRLITPPGGTVLDPFAGSGSTGVAAIREGFAFVGIEREAEYAEIAKARINAAS